MARHSKNTLKLKIDDADRAELERRVRFGRAVERANIILCRANGQTVAETARHVGCCTRIVSKWTERYQKMGLNGLLDRPGRGRKLRPMPKAVSDSEPEPATRPSVHTVARLAGVSAMTVSRVLNGRPNVSTRARTLVQEAARQCDYQPDPQLRKLMVHLRERRPLGMQGSICSLVSPGFKHVHYLQALVEGARERAKQLGFSWESFPMTGFLESPQRAFRILRSRGVDGILLPPLPQPRKLSPGSEWADFSIISVSYSLLDPEFHCVVPDQFRNMKRVCRTLAERGYRRIGLVMHKDLDKRVDHHFSGAYAAFHLAVNRPMPPVLFFSEAQLPADAYRAWHASTKPDAIVVQSAEIARWIAGESGINPPDPTAIVPVAAQEDWPIGIDELPERVAATATDILARMIAHEERGIPEHPFVTLVEGVLVERPSSQRTVNEMPKE